MEDNFEFEKSRGPKPQFIDRHIGKTPNNFVYIQDKDMVLAVGAKTMEHLKAKGIECIPYQTRWTPDFIDSIIDAADGRYAPTTPLPQKYIKVSAGVRYWEDGVINGEDDITYEEREKGVQPKMPCAELRGNEYRWNLIIDPETGIILNWKRGVKAHVHYKVCDECEIEYFEDGTLICTNESDGYVPKFLSPDAEGYGDYMIMSVDENGQIANWSTSDFQYWWAKQQK